MSRAKFPARPETTQRIHLGESLPPQRRTLTLQVVQGEQLGATIVVENDQMVIGRGEDADLSVPDTAMSREHACFWRQGDSLVVTDLNSLNGTFVEGDRISRPRKLRQGDRVTVGRVTLRFLSQDNIELKASQQMYDAAVRDHLTGLYNRAYMDERLKAEFAFAVRHNTPLAVLLMDIDHFKNVNDTHGHPVGDAILKEVSANILTGLRTEDVAARFGGEEFVVLARGIEEPGAQILAQRMRTKAEKARVPVPSGEGIVSVTLSVGIAVYRQGSPLNTPDAVVAAADEALYRAKRGGRNRAVVYADARNPTEPFNSEGM